MAAAKHVPRTDNGNVQSALPESGFAFRAHDDVTFHHGRRLSHTQIDEVLDPAPACRVNRSQSRSSINRLKLRRLGRIRMRHSYQLHKRMRRPNLIFVGSKIERVADDRFASWRQFSFTARTDEGADLMSAFDQCANERCP